MPALKYKRLYHRTILALSVVAILSLPFSVLFYVRLSQEKATSEKLTQIRERANAIDELLTQLLNLETGVRGFVSTGDRRFLDPYWEGKRQIPLVLEQLETTGQIDELNNKVKNTLTLSDQLIQKPNLKQLEQGKSVMDGIRGTLGELKEQAESYRDHLIAERTNRGRRDLLLAISAVIGVFVSLGLVYQSAKDMQALFDETQRALTAEGIALSEQRKLNDSKLAVIEVISHEYKTPLTAILTAVELLGLPEEKIQGKKERYLEQARLGVKRLNQLVDDVLVLFQIESRAMPPQERIQVPLTEWFTQLAEATGEGDRILLVVMVEFFACDEKLLHRIFSNLLSNALKYSKDSVLVRVSQISSTEVEFRVVDSGIGIPDPTRLCEPFERGSNIGTIKGTGLGLSIVKKTVELLGGTIEINSRVNEGTTVVVVLPN